MSAKVPNVLDDQGQPLKLSDGEIDQLFAPLKSFSKIALAVSGGADSICLLLTFNEWKSRSHWAGSCEVLTVDHQLRAESRSEAGFVETLSEELGNPVFVLSWVDEKPSSGVQEAARDARYKLMANHLAQSRSEVVVLAHHLDDQAETFLDRLTRGSGVFGLSAMAPDEQNGPENLRLLRPFLEVPKSRLVKTLEDRGQPWCEDPSNGDLKYKRSRLRQIAEHLSAEGLTPHRIATTAKQLRRTRAALESVLAHIFFDHVEEHSAGPNRLAKDAYKEQPEEFRLRLLILMIERVTGRIHQPKLRKIEALDRWIMADGKGRQTLGGTVLDVSRDRITAWKEVGRIPPKILDGVSGSGCWDNRFNYFIGSENTGMEGVLPLCLGPLFNAPIDRQTVPWPQGWPKEAFDCSPVFWTDKGPVQVRSAASLVWQNSYREMIDIGIQRVPFPQKMAGNYRSDLEGT